MANRQVVEMRRRFGVFPKPMCLCCYYTVKDGLDVGADCAGGSAMAKVNAYARRMCEEPPLEYRPGLLLLTFFLASSPLYQPNAGVFARLSGAVLDLGQMGMITVSVCLFASLGLFARACGHRMWEGFGNKTVAVAAVCYATTQLACPLLLWFGTTNTVVLDALSALGGFFAMPVVVAWVRCFELDFRNVVFYGSLACLGSSALTWGLSVLPVECTLVGMPAFALVGSLSVLFVGRNGVDGRPVDTKTPEREPLAMSSDWTDEAPGTGVTRLENAGCLGDLLRTAWLPVLGFFDLLLHDEPVRAGQCRRQCEERMRGWCFGGTDRAGCVCGPTQKPLGDFARTSYYPALRGGVSVFG